jgi:hypothetical protein
VNLIENWEEDANRVNALRFEKIPEKRWPEIYNTGKMGFCISWRWDRRSQKGTCWMGIDILGCVDIPWPSF